MPAEVSSPRSLRGSIVLITGAASGMGEATARLFAAEGAAVAVSDRDGDGARRVADALVRRGGNARAWRLDVAEPAQTESVVAEVAGHFGGLDILVNNAGVSGFVAIDDPAYEATWERCLAVLLSAQQRTVRAALPWLRRSAAPRIVNVASTEALGATAGNSAYAAAKGGVASLTRALAAELGKQGITVNCICPGPIRTAMTAAIPEEQKTIYARRRTALRRYGEPEEVAHMTLSLCLPAASFITGAVIPVDGGLMARNA